MNEIVTIALSLLISRSSKRTATAFALLTFTAVIFRAELLLLLVPLALRSLVARKINFWRLVRVGLGAGVVSIGKSVRSYRYDLPFISHRQTGLTVLIDTYFWKTEYPLWPELFGVYFNVVQGKSADWGVRPLFLLPHPLLPLTSPHRLPHPKHT